MRPSEADGAFRCGCTHGVAGRPTARLWRLTLSVAVILVSFAAAGCTQGSGEGEDNGRMAAAVGTARLLDGGPQAFRRRLAHLRGRPVVVNQWASWCDPCRKELPWFARLARRYQGRVAFLGVDSLDERTDATAFLRRYPTPFPHFVDPDGEVARVFFGGRAFPTTAFYSADGKLVTTHQGAYPSEAALDGDIRRYALGG
jgi:thiol-disulfide isomerase/thioredoxin